MEELFRKIGSWLFLIGILIAVVVGLITGAEIWVDTNGYINIVLAALGFVVGILSFFAVGTITQERVPTFLIAALILVGIGATAGAMQDSIGQLAIIGDLYFGVATMLAVFAAPAAGLLAIRAIWDAGKTKDIDIPQKVIKK